jgi:DNA processing protein
MTQQAIFWMAFTRVNGLGPIRIRHLRSQFDRLEDAWFASPDDLMSAGLPASALEHLVTLRQKLDPASLLEDVQRAEAWVLTLDDESYPALLREIINAPVVLYGRGNLLPQDERSVAMVGTRRASGYGKEMTKQLAGSLASAGITVISGLAAGIDAAAHQSALDVGGRSLAVLGSGIDVIYPSQHRELSRRIQDAGAIITEYPPGTKPERGNFPMRNRIISGMTLGTVIVEAPERSGSLLTAELAGEQGREVFAVPGNANSPNSRGCNLLIQDGARMVLSAEDILRELDLAHRASSARQAVKRIAPANNIEASILRQLATEPLHVDELSRACGMSIQTINATLTLMELKGLVFQTAPMTYHVAQAV